MCVCVCVCVYNVEIMQKNTGGYIDMEYLKEMHPHACIASFEFTCNMLDKSMSYDIIL